MHRALGLLLLATEGALAQSREPSDWDDKVPGYGGTVAGCPCDSATHVCNHAIYPKVEQSGTSSLEVDYAQQVGYHGGNEPVQFDQVTGNSKPDLKFAYLTDQDGTIIAYNDDWDIGSKKVTFTWDAQVSNQPTGLVPHIVLEESCADLVPSVDVWNTSELNVPRRFITRSTPISTWRAKLALLTERYDVGNSPSDVASPPSPPSPPPNQPSPPPSPSPMRGFSLGDGTSWFTGLGTTGAGKVEATTFPTLADLPDCKNVKDGCTNAAWLTNQDGTILEYEEELMKVPPNGDISKEIVFADTHFPRGTLDLHACRLFPTKKVCATENIRDMYILKMQSLTTTNSVGAYSETNTAFTDVFSGHFDKGAGRTSIGPKSNTSCTQYVIYAKKIDDGTDSLLAFAFDKAIHFAANTTYEYEVSLTCDGSTRITGTMDLKVFDAASTPEGTFADVPQPYVVVGDKKCFDDHDDHDGHDHAEGAEEAAGHPPPPPAYPSSTMENPTWFKHDGRDCICEQGTLKCKRAGAGSPFSMNEGETVGLVIAVSAIVFICIGAIFFFGYSAMLKRKARDTGVVLQSDGDRL